MISDCFELNFPLLINDQRSEYCDHQKQINDQALQACDLLLLICWVCSANWVNSCFLVSQVMQLLEWMIPVMNCLGLRLGWVVCQRMGIFCCVKSE